LAPKYLKPAPLGTKILGALPMKCSKYFGAKWHGFKVFWRQKALVVSRLKISVMIVVILVTG